MANWVIQTKFVHDHSFLVFPFLEYRGKVEPAHHLLNTWTWPLRTSTLKKSVEIAWFLVVKIIIILFKIAGIFKWTSQPWEGVLLSSSFSGEETNAQEKWGTLHKATQVLKSRAGVETQLWLQSLCSWPSHFLNNILHVI